MSNFDEIESLLSRLLMAAASVLSDAERTEVQSSLMSESAAWLSRRLPPSIPRRRLRRRMWWT